MTTTTTPNRLFSWQTHAIVDEPKEVGFGHENVKLLTRWPKSEETGGKLNKKKDGKMCK